MKEISAVKFFWCISDSSHLAEFIINRGSKVVQEVISSAWEMEEASEALIRSRLTRLKILEKALQNPCNKQCKGQWLECTKQLLSWNDISVQTFSLAVRNLLKMGRGKFWNVLLKGPANTGKTFLLNPLNVVYKTFSNPATSHISQWLSMEYANHSMAWFAVDAWGPARAPFSPQVVLLQRPRVQCRHADILHH